MKLLDESGDTASVASRARITLLSVASRPFDLTNDVSTPSMTLF